MKSTYQSTCPACGSEKAMTSTDTESSVPSHTYCSTCAWCSCEHADAAMFVRPLRVELPFTVFDDENMIVRTGSVAFTEEEFNDFVQSIRQPKPYVWPDVFVRPVFKTFASQDPLRAEVKRVEGLDD